MINLTASMIRCFKACPRKYFFEYVEMLKPIETPEALSIGSSYHSYLEKLLNGESFEVVDLPSAMAEAFDRFIPWRTWGVKDIEKEYRVKLAPGIFLAGKMDALTADGQPIEHKSSKNKPDEKYRERLFLDDQVSCYLLALSIMRGEPQTHITYTVCQKPTVKPAKKLDGDPEAQAAELLARQRAWFDEEKVASFTVVRVAQELEDFKKELIFLGRSLQQPRKIYYRNPMHCERWGKCAYQSICQDYDPECLVGFVKKERQSEELENLEW